MAVVRLNQATIMIAVGFLLTCCSQTTITTVASLDVATTMSHRSSSPQVSETLLPLTETPSPAHTLLPIDAGHQIVQNSSFNTGISHWDQRIGKLSHSTSQYYTEPGAGLIITHGLDYVGVAGQCISIQERLIDWPTIEDQKQIAFDAFLKTDINIDQVSLLLIFHQEDCRRQGQLRVQVGTMQSIPLPGEQDWTHLSTSGIIPSDALSVDVIIWALGKNDTARVYFDDVRSYPSSQQ